MPHLASIVGAAAIPKPKVLTGVVVSAGKMEKCVKVRIAKQKWNKKVKKYYASPFQLLVHDPANSTREGDVVMLQSGWRTGRHVFHVISSIVAPMGPPISQRPPVPTEVERIAAAEAKRAAKDVRQAAKGRLVAVTRVKRREKQQRVLQRVLAHRVAMKVESLGAQIGKLEKQAEYIRGLVEGRKSERDEEMKRREQQRADVVKHDKEAEKSSSPIQEKTRIEKEAEKKFNPLQEKAQHSKQKAKRLEEKGLENEKKLEEVVDKLEEQPKREGNREEEKKGWARWFGR